MISMEEQERKMSNLFLKKQKHQVIVSYLTIQALNTLIIKIDEADELEANE